MIRLAVRVHRRQAELVLAELLELAPSGVEEVQVSDDVVEYAVYGAPGELPAVPALRAAAGGAYVDVRSEEIADDWADRWRSFHRPLTIAGRLTVRPPWEPPAGTALDVVIDPGRAFGTGSHATTALCLELLLAEPPGRSLIDLGCGSGVLAIVASRLGWRSVLALDYDPVAVEATLQNAQRNQVALEARRLDMLREQVPEAELVVANVLSGPLIRWAAEQELMPPRLILSGLLAGEVDEVSIAFGRRGLRERERRTRGEWAAVVLDGATG
ncbi:MAG: 50S ribosomal protein L11 methyltransferase [Solirubrobacteraceae bacterium]